MSRLPARTRVLAVGLLLSALCASAAGGGLPHARLSDQFNAPGLDATKWSVVKGKPAVQRGRLVLSGSGTTEEVQSRRSFRYGVLRMSVDSVSWKDQQRSTDSSFGFEIWNGRCHSAVVLIANGHLGVLRAKAHAGGACSGDPRLQSYAQITNWAMLHAAHRPLEVVLSWRPGRVTLRITTADGSTTGVASYTGSAEPQTALRVRLNADRGESYRIEYVKLDAVPAR